MSEQTEPTAERSAGYVLKRHAAAFGPALLLLPLAFAFPKFDLSSGLAAAVVVLTDSGGKPGIPFVALLCTALLVSRAGMSLKQRVKEGTVILGSLGVIMLAVALANEHAIKPGFAVPRPDIVELADAGALGTTPEAFYGLGDKDARREYLGKRQEHPAFQALHPSVRHHWIEETGFSFPSGHSQASMAFASYFFAMALALLSGWRLGILCALPLWGLLVCWSRPFLRVHSPTDISVGGLSGVLIGLAAFAVGWAILKRLSAERTTVG